MATKAEQLAALQKQMEELQNSPDEEDYEVHIFDGDKGVTMPFSKAKGWLSKNGFSFDDADPTGGDGEEPPADGGDGGDGKAGRGYFNGPKK